MSIMSQPTQDKNLAQADGGKPGYLASALAFVSRTFLTMFNRAEPTLEKEPSSPM
jgi:hypothetical protein